MAQSDNLLWMQAPELAQARRRQLMAQRLMEQGGDSSPILSPWQGVDRLAKALIGGYQSGQADREVEAYGAERKAKGEELDAAAAALMGGGMPAVPVAPAVPAQQGADSVQRQALAPAEYEPLIAQASAETGIPAPLLTSLYQTESGFRPDAVNPKSGATGIGQVLASTAANPGYGLQPIAPEALRDPRQAIPWTARYLAARGKSAGVSDWADPAQAERGVRAYGENTPEYAQRVLGGGGLATPVAAPQGGQQAPGIDPFAQVRGLAALAQKAAAAGDHQRAQIYMQQAQMAQQLATMRAPQPKNPILVGVPGDPTASVYKNPEEAVGMPGPPRAAAVQVNTGERAAEKKIVDAWDVTASAVEEGKRREALFQNIEQALPSFATGATAEIRLKGAQVLQALGFETNAPAGEVLSAVQKQLELANTPKGQGQITENERVLIRQMLPVMGSTPEGLKMLIDMTRRLDARDREVLGIFNESARRNGGAPNPLEVREAVSALPPALPASFTDRLAPWKPAAPTAPSGERPPPPPGFVVPGR